MRRWHWNLKDCAIYTANRGIVDTVRLLDQFMTGSGNYTEESRAAIENQTLDEVLAEVYASQGSIDIMKGSL